MNILLIHQYFLEPDDPGGSRFNEMTKVWTEKGHQVTVICGMMNYVTGKKNQKYKGRWTYTSYYDENIKVIRSFVSDQYNKSFYGRFWAYFSFVVSSIYAGLFKTRESYDIILTTSPPLFLGITAYVLKTVKRIPLVFEVRDLWPESAIETGVLTNKMIIRWAYSFEKFIYRESSLINVLTPAYLDELVTNKQISAEKIIMIPNGADFSLSDKLLNEFDAKTFRSELGFTNQLVVIYVGAHGLANNLIQLINAAEKLEGTIAHFLLVGDGMEKPMLVQEVKNRKLTNVTFIDPVPKKEVFKYILASDIGTAILKKADTFKTIYSNKTFDYMACKKPVVAAIDGVTRKLIKEVGCGSFVEPENPKQLSETIKHYINCRHLLDTQGSAGYNYAKKKFDRVKLAEQYLNDLESLVQEDVQ